MPEEEDALMDPDVRLDLIARYRDGHRVVEDALQGITPDELDAQSTPGEWSACQVVHHLADSEMTSAIRLRRLIAENDPQIDGYDEEGFAERLHYDRPIEASLDALGASRATTTEILERLSEDEWSRAGSHSEIGPYGVETWLEIYASHAHDHAEQIRRARGTRS
ncbi:putative metal-dependent hydrolase [soil metagenome]